MVVATATRPNEALRIGQLAAIAGVNPRTIRYYEAIGLVRPRQRTESGYRLYGRDERERLAFILRAKRLGFTLREIGSILQESGRRSEPCAEVLQILERKIAATEQELQVLARRYRGMLDLRMSARARVLRAQHSTREPDWCVCRIIEEFSAPP